MRLWSIHPKYLDSKGLVALWREALLAKKVLMGKTKGYRHHPQIIRFQKYNSPVASINNYLCSIWIESADRGYSFNKNLIGYNKKISLIPVSEAQLLFELDHLRRKLKLRDKKQLKIISGVKVPLPNPLFFVRNGPVESWEKTMAVLDNN
jgi:hypothetical protein